MKEVFPEIISPNQSTFVKGEMTTDNVITFH